MLRQKEVDSLLAPVRWALVEGLCYPVKELRESSSLGSIRDDEIEKLSYSFCKISVIGSLSQVLVQHGKKWEELQVCVQLQDYDLMGPQGDMVGYLAQLECCNEWIWSLGEGQAKKARRGSCPLFERAAGVHRALPEKKATSVLRSITAGKHH